MSRMEETEAHKQLQQMCDHLAPSIGKAHIFSGLVNGHNKMSATFAMQIGIAILLDKPLFMLFSYSCMPTQRVINLVDGYEMCDETDAEDVKAATERLMKQAVEYMKKKKESDDGT